MRISGLEAQLPYRYSPTALASNKAESLDKVTLSADPSGGIPEPSGQQDLAFQAAVPALPGPVGLGFQSGFVTGYLEPSEVESRARALAERYPDLVELVERPYQTEGYDGSREDLQGPARLYYLRLGPRQPDRDQKLGVFQFAAPHAREWVDPMIMVELAEQLVVNYDPDSEDPRVRENTQLLDSLDIFIAPMTNPDGTNFSFHDSPRWRKNRADVGEGERGVDINRNYPYQWLPSEEKSSFTYSGSGPASEPETRHIIEVVEDHPNIRFVVDWHSSGEQIRKPWGISDQDLPLYEQFHSRLQEAIASHRGTEYEMIYSLVINGSSDDYFYHDKGLFSTTMETAKEFQPEVPEALEVMRENVEGAHEVLRFARDYQAQRGLSLAEPPLETPAPPPAS